MAERNKNQRSRAPNLSRVNDILSTMVTRRRTTAVGLQMCSEVDSFEAICSSNANPPISARIELSEKPNIREALMNCRKPGSSRTDTEVLRHRRGYALFDWSRPRPALLTAGRKGD